MGMFAKNVITEIIDYFGFPVLKAKKRYDNIACEFLIVKPVATRGRDRLQHFCAMTNLIHDIVNT